MKKYIFLFISFCAVTLSAQSVDSTLIKKADGSKAFAEFRTDWTRVGTNLHRQEYVSIGNAQNFNHTLTLTGATGSSLGFYATTPNGSSKNWAIFPNYQQFGDFSINTGNNNGDNPISAGTSKFYINNVGHVGINTVTPTHKLHIADAADPLRVQGIVSGATGLPVLTVDNTGVVKQIAANDLITYSQYTSKSATGNVLLTEFGTIKTSGSITLTLPAMSISLGRVVTFWKSDATTTLIIKGNGADPINGANTQTLVGQYSRMTLHCNGSEWMVIGQ